MKLQLKLHYPTVYTKLSDKYLQIYPENTLNISRKFV